jgi:hypothetical protein
MMCVRFRPLPVFLVAALLLMPLASFSQQTNALESLRIRYETARQRIDADALLTYSKALGVEMTRLKQKGDLDTYIALETEKARFEAAKALPEGKDREVIAGKVAGLDSAIKNVEADRIARTASLLRQYVAQLESQIKQLMQADKMDEAKAAKEVLEEAKFNMDDVAGKLSKRTSRKPDAAVAAEKTGRRLVIWNSHNGSLNNNGTLACDITLFNGSFKVWQKKDVRMPWQPNVDTNVAFEVPAGMSFTRARVDITKWAGRGGSLSEIEVWDNSTNTAQGCSVSASGYLNVDNNPPLPEYVTDGNASSADEFSCSYWVLPSGTPGWIEVDLTSGKPSSSTGEAVEPTAPVAPGRLPKSLVIEKATYGNPREGVDVTKQLQDQVQDGRLIVTPRTYDAFSEMTGIKTKTLTIKYSYNKELARTITRRQGEVFSLP